MAKLLEGAVGLVEKYDLTLWRLIAILISVYLVFQVCQSLITAVYNVYFHPLRKFPGTHRLEVAFPFLRYPLLVRGRREASTIALHEKYGEIVRATHDMVLFTSPVAWKDIYGHGHPEIPKVVMKDLGFDEKKIFSANQADHGRFRRAMAPAFSDKALSQQEPLILVYVNLLIEKLRETAKIGQPTNMVRWYNFTTFDLMADLTFGQSLGGLASGQSNGWIDNLNKFMRFFPVLILTRLSPITALFLKFFAGSKMRNAQEQHEAYSKELTMSRIERKGMGDRGDFMDYFLRSRGEPHEMTNEELAANGDFLMIAGSHTTSTLLSGVTYWLLKTPKALEKVVKEVRQAFDKDSDITFREATVKLPYMLAVLDEGLRMFPPVPLALMRKTKPGAPTPIAGYLVPPNTMVGVHHLAVYQSERYFHRAKEFIPERWLPESVNNPDSPFFNDTREAHQPFNVGPRNCIGRNLAYHEMRLILAKVLWNYDLELMPECAKWHDQRIFGSWELPPLQVVVKDRKRG